MNWKKFAIICGALIVVMFLAVFLLNVTSKNLITRQIDDLQEQIAKREDGSSLIYDELETSGDHVEIARIIYQDGRTGGRFALFGVDANLNTNGLDQFNAERLEWINGAGNLLTLNHITASDISKNESATHEWNEYLFSLLQGEDLSIEGVTQSGDPVTLRAEQMVLTNLTPSVLDKAAIQDIDIRYTPELSAHLDVMRLNDLEYGQIDEIVAMVEEGYIPVNAVAELSDTDITMEGLQLQLDGKDVLDSQISGLDEEQLLQFFLDNAPRELQNILGTDAGQLTAIIENLSQQDPNDLAIGALEAMINLLQRNQRDQ